MITDISAELEKEFGAPGTPERAKFDEEAYAFYTGQILRYVVATGNKITTLGDSLFGEDGRNKLIYK